MRRFPICLATILTLSSIAHAGVLRAINPIKDRYIVILNDDTHPNQVATSRAP